MKKALWSAAAAVAFLASASTASAQLATQQINATININSLARLTVSGDVLFADADPDVVATLTAPAITVTARARVQPTENLVVTVVAGNAYFDTTSTIPVSGLTWTATGAVFANGTMSSTTPQTVASWTGPNSQSGTQTYSLPNLWSYAPGTHTVILTYTLANP
jgi:hypothetical protein